MSQYLKDESTLSDKHLFKEVSGGNEQAFQIIFNRYYKRMFSFAVKVVKSTHAAEEIVQVVFIGLWEQRELLNEIKSPENYLFIVIRNHAFNYLRAAANESSRREQLWDALRHRSTEVSSSIEMEEVDLFYERIVNKLTAQQQKVFRLSREEGYSHQQIADEMNLSKLTVKKHVADSLKVLKGYLKYFSLFFF